MSITGFFRKLKFIFRLAYLAPFFTGPVLIFLPSAEIFLSPFLKRYLSFLALCSFWALMLYYVMHHFSLKSKEEARNKSKLKTICSYVLLIALAILATTSLETFRANLPALAFYLALVGVALSSIEQVTRQKGMDLLSIWCGILWTSLATYLGFVVATLEWYTQPILISFGVGCLVSSISLSKLLVRKSAVLTVENAENSKEKKYFIGYCRMHSMLVLCSLIMVATLCHIGNLEANYLAVFFSLPFMAKLIGDCRNAEKSLSLPNSFVTKTEGVAFLFVALLFSVAIIQRYLVFHK